MQQAMLFPMTVVSPRGLPENSANVYREMAMARQKVTFQDVSISKINSWGFLGRGSRNFFVFVSILTERLFS